MRQEARAQLTAILAGSLCGCASVRQEPITAETTEPSKLSSLLEHFESAARQHGAYALIICGNCEGFRGNVSLAYQVLLEEGVKSDHIFILVDGGEATPFYPAAGPATLQALKMVLESFSRALNHEDSLFVYVSDHGQRTNTTPALSTIVLDDGEIDEIAFQDLIDAVDVQYKVFLFDQCYGGGFAARLGVGSALAIAVAPPNRLSNGNGFPRAFFGAFRNKQDADINHDGLVSLWEAFHYAVKHDRGTRVGHNKPRWNSGADLDPRTLGLLLTPFTPVGPTNR